jgi:hypothetical protein
VHFDTYVSVHGQQHFLVLLLLLQQLLQLLCRCVQVSECGILYTSRAIAAPLNGAAVATVAVEICHSAAQITTCCSMQKSVPSLLLLLLLVAAAEVVTAVIAVAAAGQAAQCW